MYTYTFPQDYFNIMMNHMLNFSITIENLTLTNGTYTMTCNSRIEEDQYNHLHDEIQLTEIV